MTLLGKKEENMTNLLKSIVNKASAEFENFGCTSDENLNDMLEEIATITANSLTGDISNKITIPVPLLQYLIGYVVTNAR